MSKGQIAVLVLLLILVVIETGNKEGGLKGMQIFLQDLTHTNVKKVFYYGVGALALIALASPLPKVAIAFTLLIMTAAAISHKDVVEKMIAFPK